jgi:hypothetical protein
MGAGRHRASSAALPHNPRPASRASRWHSRSRRSYLTFGGTVSVCAYPSRMITTFSIRPSGSHRYASSREGDQRVQHVVSLDISPPSFGQDALPKSGGMRLIASKDTQTFTLAFNGALPVLHRAAA